MFLKKIVRGCEKKNNIFMFGGVGGHSSSFFFDIHSSERVSSYLRGYIELGDLVPISAIFTKFKT